MDRCPRRSTRRAAGTAGIGRGRQSGELPGGGFVPRGGAGRGACRERSERACNAIHEHGVRASGAAMARYTGPLTAEVSHPVPLSAVGILLTISKPHPLQNNASGQQLPARREARRIRKSPGTGTWLGEAGLEEAMGVGAGSPRRVSRRGRDLRTNGPTGVRPSLGSEPATLRSAIVVRGRCARR